jgi:hypothetical protein
LKGQRTPHGRHRQSRAQEWERVERCGNHRAAPFHLSTLARELIEHATRPSRPAAMTQDREAERTVAEPLLLDVVTANTDSQGHLRSCRPLVIVTMIDCW